MAWNLINTLNSDLEKGNVFDDLPETSQKLAAQAKVPSTQEIAPPPSFDSGPVISRPVQLNGSTDIGQSEVLAPPKDVASLGKSEGVFDSIPPVNERVRSPFKESDLPAEVSVPANGRVNGTPRELTLGESFQKAKGVLQQMDAYHKAHNYGSARDRGINTAQYEAAKAEVMSQLGDFLENTYGIAKSDVPSLFVGLTKTAAGFRTAQEIDEIHDIVKNGAVYTNLQGEQVSLPRNSNWGNALTAYDDRFTANIHKKPEKPVEDKTVDEIAKLNTTRDGVNAMPEGPSKTALLEVLDKKENDLTGGKANYNRHVAMENTIATAVKNMSPGGSKTKTNWLGKDFKEKVDPNDPTSNMTSFEKLADMAATGQLPTATLSKDGANLRAADAYIKKFDVLSTPVGVWNAQTGTLDMFRYTPSEDADKQLVPMTSLASPDSAAKPSPTPEPVSEDDARYPTAAGKFGANAAKSISEMVGGVNDMLDNSVVTTAVGQKNIGPLLYNAGANVVEAVAGASGKPLELKRTPYYRTPTVEENKANRAKRMARLQGIQEEPKWVPNDEDLRADGSKK